MFPILSKIVDLAGGENTVMESLYGFIMPLVLLVTALFGIVSVDNNLNMVILILGMNFSWGFIDMMLFHYVDNLSQKRYIRVLTDDSPYETKRTLIKKFLSGSVVGLMDEKDEDRIIDEVLKSELKSSDEIKQITHDDLISSAMCLVITMLTTIPPILCLIFVPELRLAMTVAAVTSSIFLFIVGWKIGPYLGIKGWKTGAALLIISMTATTVASIFGG